MYRSQAQSREFGVPAGPYTGTRVVDVRKLSEPVRRVLAETLAGDRSPAPLIAARAWNVRALAGQGVAVAGIVVFGVVALDLGALFGAWWSERGPGWAALYAFLLVAMGLGMVVRWGCARREGKRPLPQGTFWLPLDLLVIEGWRMTVRPFGDARHVDIDEAGRAVTATYADGRILRVQGERATKTSLLADLLSAQHTLEDATLAGTPDRDDRLGELRTSEWKGVLATESDAPAALPSRRLLALVGAVAGLLVWQARLRVDDELRFRAARALDSRRGYDAYLARGTAHAREVEEDLVPNVVLRDADRAGGRTDAYAAFLRRYPDGPRATFARGELDTLCAKRFRQETADNDDQIARFETHNEECKIPEQLELEARAAHQAAQLDTMLRSLRIDALFDFVGRNHDPGTLERAKREINARVQSAEHGVEQGIPDKDLRAELLALVARAHALGRPVSVRVRLTGAGTTDASAADFAAGLARRARAASEPGLVTFQITGPADVTWSLALRQEAVLMYDFKATRVGGGPPIAVRRVALIGAFLAKRGWDSWLGDQLAGQVLGSIDGLRHDL